jgi:hypothetical protein
VSGKELLDCYDGVEAYLVIQQGQFEIGGVLIIAPIGLYTHAVCKGGKWKVAYDVVSGMWGQLCRE